MRARPEWKVFRFDPDLGRWIAGAKLVIIHLGKTALDAALTYRKPLVIVPDPKWARHGASLEDARMLAKKLNAVLVEPQELSAEKLEEATEETMKRKPPIPKRRQKTCRDNGQRVLVECYIGGFLFLKFNVFPNCSKVVRDYKS